MKRSKQKRPNIYITYNITRIVHSEHKVSPIATVEGVANCNGTSVTSNEFDAILNILEGLHINKHYS